MIWKAIVTLGDVASDIDVEINIGEVARKVCMNALYFVLGITFLFIFIDNS